MTSDFAPEVAKCPQNPQIAFEMLTILCHLAGQSQCHTQPSGTITMWDLNTRCPINVLLRCYVGALNLQVLKMTDRHFPGPVFSRSCIFSRPVT